MAKSEWIRCTRNNLCKVCQKPDWCSISADGTAAMCQRVESSKRCGDAGWLHKLSDPIPEARVRRIRKREEPKPDVDWTQLAKDYAKAVDRGRLMELAARLGVTSESLKRLRIGWDGEAWTFPMWNSFPRVVGIRRRFDSGRKLSVKGGSEGLFMGRECMAPDGPIFVCEGPTDLAALLDAGVAAIGRPSSTGGTKLIVDMAANRGRDIVLITDFDPPGSKAEMFTEKGAERLAGELSKAGVRTKIIVPLRGKDVRAWKPSRDALLMCERNADWYRSE